MQELFHFLEKKKWRQLKKSDWAVMGLVGVLLLVLALPTGEHKEKEGMLLEQKTEEKEQGKEAAGQQYSDVEYAGYLEERLKQVLGQMEGVGRVEVMITVSDKGERVVEKETAQTGTVTTETDQAGGSRSISEQTSEETAIYTEIGSESAPYVRKELLPKLEGVVVVAEGGGDPSVVSNISEAVKALLPIEAHRIKVVKMCSKEE